MSQTNPFPLITHNVLQVQTYKPMVTSFIIPFYKLPLLRHSTVPHPYAH